MVRRLLLLAAMLAASARPAASRQSGGAEPVTVPRALSPVRFDGRPDEPAWVAAVALPLVQQTPTYGARVATPTDLRLLHDDAFVYLGVRAFDEVPPTETTFRRDAWSDNDDQVGIGLDTFDDRENLMVFVLYSTGARIDAMLFNDSRTEADINLDWNTFWDGRVSRDERGWYGEIRIPVSSLRFEPGADGSVTMGINAYRYVARAQEIDVFPDVPPEWGFLSFLKASKGERLRFEGLRPVRPLHVTPYVTGGVGQTWVEREDGSGFERRDDPARDAGFDVKVGLTGNLTLDVTANTDFAQVEADDEQVNLTRFSLFFPEKRRFFLERTSNFTFSFGGDDGLFYSRRIGIAGGEQVPLIGGARLVGRVGGLDVGGLVMQSARRGAHASAEAVPSTNFGVVRLKSRVFNANSYVGAILTSRLAGTSAWNSSAGVDGLIRLFNSEYAQFAWAQTWSDSISTPLAAPAAVRYRFRVFRDREDGLRYGVGIGRSGARFDPAMGFQARTDFTRAGGLIGWGFRPGEPSPISSHAVSLDGTFFWRNADRALETSELEARHLTWTRTAWLLDLAARHTKENLPEGFDLSRRVSVPAGRYSFTDATARVMLPSRWPLGAALEAGYGGYFGGRHVRVAVEPRWSPTPRVKLTGSWEYDRIRFERLGQTFESLLLRTTVELTWSTSVTLSALVQYNSTEDALSTNVRFRYNPREGNDFYLVWNEGIETERPSRSPLTTSRTLLAKYTVTFSR